MENQIIGFVDSIDDNNEIKGWALDESNPDVPLVIKIFFSDRIVGAGVADVRRDDIDRLCGFILSTSVPISRKDFLMGRAWVLAFGASQPSLVEIWMDIEDK